MVRSMSVCVRLVGMRLMCVLCCMSNGCICSVDVDVCLCLPCDYVLIVVLCVYVDLQFV